MLKNECTVVTAYYDFSKKKHSSNTYYKWMKTFLSLPCKMIIYVGSQDIYDIVKTYRSSFESSTKVILLPLEELYCYQMMDYWEKDYTRDHEKYHSPLLYIIWNEKTAFLKKAKDANPFETEFFCWADIGMVREEFYLQHIRNFPSKQMLNICDKKKVHLLSINPFTDEEYSTVTDASNCFRYYKDRIGGGVILCHCDIVDEWYDLYYKMLHRFMELNLFAGKDQSIMNCLYLCLCMKNINFVNLISPIKSPIDNWFYMLHYLSDSYFEKTNN